jgi:hypothetical protein
VVSTGKRVLLFVTLEKEDLPEAHRYQDRFLAPDLFQWQSQNRTPKKGKMGRLLSSPEEHGVEIFLFVRRRSKEGGTTAPFVYCGQPKFVDWAGEKPITIRWRLTAPVPEYLRERLGVPGEASSR